MTHLPEDSAIESHHFPEIEAQIIRMERTLVDHPQAETGYRQQLNYTVEQLGGAEEAYRLFQASRFSFEQLPSRTRQAPQETNSTLFGIYDLPILNELRRQNPLKTRSMAEHAAVAGVELVGDVANNMRRKVIETIILLREAWDMTGDPHA